MRCPHTTATSSPHLPQLGKVHARQWRPSTVKNKFIFKKIFLNTEFHKPSKWLYMYIMCMLVVQLCLTLCDPMDCNPPVSSLHGMLQARILERVAIPFSRGSSWPRDWTWVSCITGRFFTTRPPEKPLLVFWVSVNWENTYWQEAALKWKMLLILFTLMASIYIWKILCVSVKSS